MYWMPCDGSDVRPSQGYHATVRCNLDLTFHPIRGLTLVAVHQSAVHSTSSRGGQSRLCRLTGGRSDTRSQAEP